MNPTELTALAVQVADVVTARITAAIALRGHIDSAAILTTQEAATLALFESENGFRAWAKQWRVQPSGHGRWPRHRIEAGLRREATQGGRKARKPYVRKSAEAATKERAA